MIYNEKRFSAIAFMRHITKVDNCSQCNKTVTHRKDTPSIKKSSRYVGTNYHEFVFGVDYKELLEKFYSGLVYTNFLLYNNDKVKISSFSLIHNSHDDSFFVAYYHPVTGNKEIIKENNTVLEKVFVKYTTSQRKKIIDDIWYYYRDIHRLSEKLDNTQKNDIDTKMRNALTCIDHDSYELNQTDDNTKIKEIKINLAECDDLLHPDLMRFIKNRSRTGTDPLFEYKARLQAYIYNSYLEWISKTDSFPELSCNECIGRKKLSKIFKNKHEVKEMRSPLGRLFGTPQNYSQNNQK